MSPLIKPTIILLLVPLAFCQQNPQCNQTMPEVASMKPNFGGLNPFYDMAKGISDGLQSTPNQKTYNDLNNLIFGNGAVSYDTVIQDMVVNQIGAIIFWSVGFVFVLAALVLGIATAVWQCCYSCVPKESSVRRSCTGYVYGALLFVLFSLVLTGTILFNITQTKLTNSIDNAMDYTSRITTDLSNVMAAGSSELTCEVNTTTTQTFTNMTLLIQSYPDLVMNGTADQIGLTAVNNFNYLDYEAKNNDATDAGNTLIQAMKAKNCNAKASNEDLADQIRTKVLPALVTLSEASVKIRTQSQLIAINKQMSDSRAQIQTQVNIVTASMQSAQTTISSTTQSISNMLDNIQHDVDNVVNTLQSGHRDVMTSDVYPTIKVLLRIVVTIPAVLGCIFSLFAIVAIAFSLRDREGIALRLATWVLVSFYITIVLAIILLLVSSLAYVFGWFMSAMCVPIFEDNQFHLFHLMNQTIPIQDGSGMTQPDVVNIGGVLQACQDPSETIYDAINGTQIINADSITSQLNLEVVRDQINSQLADQETPKYTVDQSIPDLQSALTSYFDAEQKADLKSCDDASQKAFTDYISKLQVSVDLTNQFYGNLKELSQKANQTTTIAQQQNNVQFKKGNDTMNDSIDTLMYSLNNDVFKCNPLVEIYNNGGHVMCEQFGKPIQGLWASVGLCGVVLFFLSILLLLTYRWLKTGDDEFSSTSFSTKPSKNLWDSSENDVIGARRLGSHSNHNMADHDPTADLYTPSGRLPRVRPYELDEQPTSMFSDFDDSMGTQHYPRVQVLPDSRHPPMNPHYFDDQDGGTSRLTRFDDVDLFGDYPVSNHGSTQRGLRRF